MSKHGPRRWPLRLRCGLSAAAIALTAACSPSPDRPVGLRGEWLVDLGSIDCAAEPLISRSPDGRWLAFWLSYFRPDAGLSLPISSPALVDWDDRRLLLPAGPADQVSGPSFDTASMCWDDGTQSLFMRASSLSSEAAGRWFFTSLQAEETLTPSGPPPANCARPVEQEWQWHRPATHRPELRRGLNITRQGCCELVLSSRDGQVLAVHEAQHEISEPLQIIRLAWSPDGEALAYTLSEQISWRFALPGLSYLVRLDQPTERLDGEVFSFGWLDNEHLIGCAKRPWPGGGNGLRLWHISAD